MIAIFKTNVVKKKDAAALVKQLLQYYPQSRVNFDLQDCDKILRIDMQDLQLQKIIGIINEHGFSCVELD